jgi:hypothetical protein
MVRSPATVAPGTIKRRKRSILSPPSVTLALWRLRQIWRLLLIAGLGNIAAVLLVCVVPLFTQVALSAGLRNLFTNQTQGSQIVINAFGGATQQDAEAAGQQLDTIIATDMGSYVQRGKSLFSISLQDVMVPSGSSSNSFSGPPLQVFGTDLSKVARQYTIIAGRLPAATSSDFEVAISQSTAGSLDAQVGTILHAQIPGPQPTPLDLHVVGIYSPPPVSSQTGSGQYGGTVVMGPGGSLAGMIGTRSDNLALASDLTLFTFLHTSGLDSQGPKEGPPPVLNWAYPLDTARITTNSLNDLLDRLGRVQTDVSGQLNGSHGLQGVFLDMGAYAALSNYRIQILLLQIPLMLLVFQVIALVLLFTRMMAEMLVDRQAEAIAILRSRGATRRQVFNAFTLHNVSLSLLAMIVGPLLAIPIVRYLSLRALPPASQNAVDTISGNPLTVALGLKWYVLVAVVAAGFAMVFSTNRAASRNILTLRQENARATTKPFWQRLNLDLIFGGLSLIGYVGYMLAVRQVSPRVQLILSPLSLLAALLILIAAALLFLRLLPILLGLGSQLAARGRGATSMVALTQMARAPKQPIRMTLLLALSTGFTLFTLIYSASQAQRLVDVASFQTGADFTGTISASLTKDTTLSSLTDRYAAIPGVTSATLGYTASLDPGSVSAGIPVQLFAVDADTYAQSATWTAQDSTQSLGELMAQLRAARPTATSQDAVPAILDDATWQAFHLSPGSTFTMQPPGDTQQMRFLAVARVRLIPTVYDSFQGGGFEGTNGGVLVDYQSFAAVYQHDVSSAAPQPNAAWLATQDDAASLASVRQALSTGNLALGSLQDRRKVLDDERNNPLQIDMANTLLIGAVTALLLALVGIWVGSWLNARSRVVNFAVLRALGTTPRQMRGMLVWEQVIIYIAGLALGIVLGWVLSLTALPLLIFSELASGGNFFIEPNVPPARVIVPGATLGLAFGVLVVICVLALLLTMGALARLSLGQTLRLNED